MQDKIIAAPVSSKRIKQLYDFLSPFYEYLTKYENFVKDKGLELAEIKSCSLVLDVAVGTGQTLIEAAQRVGRHGRVCGIDLSANMLELTRSRVQNARVTPRVHLKLGDARQLPYRQGVFDVVFNSFMLDLIDTPEIPHVLAEFKRVLKPGGRLLVVSMSKGDRWYSNMKLYEWFYSQFPLLLGGCRPVLTKSFIETLGFENVNRELVLLGHMIPSEIVWGDKPQAS